MSHRELSVRLERDTGYDSIPTIERLYYDPDDEGRYLCPFPRCPTVRKSAESMWRHVHFTRKHKLSFRVATPAELEDHKGAPS